MREARVAAGLSLAEVAGSEVSRTMIHFVETGQSRPSKRVLGLIARRTGKPLSYFMWREKDELRDRDDVAAELSAAAHRLKRLVNARNFGDVEREALLFAQVTLRQAASLTRSIQRAQLAPSRVVRKKIRRS